jgi:hypothetical protein
MPAHYISLAALRLACRWAAERATPHPIAAAVSRPEPTGDGSISLL